MSGRLDTKSSIIDRDGTNPSSNQWLNAIALIDKDDETIGFINGIQRTDGSQDLSIGAITEKTDNTLVENYIQIRAKKDGSKTYAIADAANFRSAISAAAASHGNHVPTTQTADNTKFLRNDNTWQKVTPSNIGALASSLVKFTRCAGGIEFTTWDGGTQIDFYTDTARKNGYAFSVSTTAITFYKLTNGSYSSLKAWS